MLIIYSYNILFDIFVYITWNEKRNGRISDGDGKRFVSPECFGHRASVTSC